MSERDRPCKEVERNIAEISIHLIPNIFRVNYECVFDDSGKGTYLSLAHVFRLQAGGVEHGLKMRARTSERGGARVKRDV